jgi:hypothetical protein
MLMKALVDNLGYTLGYEPINSTKGNDISNARIGIDAAIIT